MRRCEKQYIYYKPDKQAKLIALQHAVSKLYTHKSIMQAHKA